MGGKTGIVLHCTTVLLSFSGDVPDIAIRLIAAVVILIVTAINVYGVKAATKIQVFLTKIDGSFWLKLMSKDPLLCDP